MYAWIGAPVVGAAALPLPAAAAQATTSTTIHING